MFCDRNVRSAATCIERLYTNSRPCVTQRLDHDVFDRSGCRNKFSQRGRQPAHIAGATSASNRLVLLIKAEATVRLVPNRGVDFVSDPALAVPARQLSVWHETVLRGAQVFKRLRQCLVRSAPGEQPRVSVAMTPDRQRFLQQLDLRLGATNGARARITADCADGGLDRAASADPDAAIARCSLHSLYPAARPAHPAHARRRRSVGWRPRSDCCW